MPWNNTIYKRVMEVIKAKIKEAQKEYDDGIVVLEKKLEEDKVTLADKLVNAILGKIL